jgi:hypothetical protein
VLISNWHTLACTTAFVALEVDRDCLGEVVVEVADILLGKCLPGDNYVQVSYRSCSVGDVAADEPSKACSTLMASLALVSKYGMPPFDWQKVMARLDEI